LVGALPLTIRGAPCSCFPDPLDEGRPRFPAFLAHPPVLVAALIL